MEQTWGRRFQIPSLPDPCDDPILTSATITFKTSGDDKDQNNTMWIKIFTVYNTNLELVQLMLSIMMDLTTHQHTHIHY